MRSYYKHISAKPKRATVMLASSAVEFIENKLMEGTSLTTPQQRRYYLKKL